MHDRVMKEQHRWTDICNSRVAFVTEKGSKLLDVGTKYRYRKNKKCKHLHF